MIKPGPAKKAATKPVHKKLNGSSKPATVQTKRKPAVAKSKPAVAVKATPTATPPVVTPKPATKVAKAPAKRIAAPSMPKEKIKKPKLVRDSFTMPEAEYVVLGAVKKACLKAGIAVKKSELLRVGVALIAKMEPSKVKEVLASLPPLKAGRPKKEK